ncbi:hypothetical protein KM043_000747 [Ampulex compressa]|nr:hypothetical protein KM043_000747 [Ampulex compressa]
MEKHIEAWTVNHNDVETSNVHRSKERESAEVFRRARAERIRGSETVTARAERPNDPPDMKYLRFAHETGDGLENIFVVAFEPERFHRAALLINNSADRSFTVRQLVDKESPPVIRTYARTFTSRFALIGLSSVGQPLPHQSA